ncbi:hypothetical protein LG314_05045 [Agrococcus terreus]|uniref:hypothetical protein n=1 Tax=Agrococcus terreus TaxID=574649 RepID=UPI00384FFBF0
MTTRPGRWISVVLIVLGSIGALWAVGGGIVRGTASHGATSGSWTAPADGATEVRITSAVADVEVVFGDVDEASLEVTSSGGPLAPWSLEREGDAVVVVDERSGGWFGPGFGFGDRDRDGWGWGWRDWDRRGAEQRAVLTLPAELEREGLDLTADVQAGSLDAAGDWGAVVLDLQAGGLDVAGSADSLDLEVAAGEARLDLAVAGDVGLDVSAGRVIGALTGDQPSSIVASASAGSIELDVPGGDYAVTEDVSAGSARILVDEDQDAASTIDATVSAGSVVLRGER